MHNSSRRRFLSLGAKTLAGAGLSLGADPMLTLAQAASGDLAGSNDYRALVCVFLQGGCDGFSLMVPTGNAEHGEYRRSRGALAVPQNQLLPLSSLSANTPTLGLHPAAQQLQQLFNEGQLAMLANVGNLVEPVTKELYENHAVKLPAQLFSHADQAIQWQQLQGANRSQAGWGALAADYLSELHTTNNDYLTSVSLEGNNYWQAGNRQRPFSVRQAGLQDYVGIDAGNPWESPRRDAFQQVLDLPRTHLMTSAYADVQSQAIKITTELGAVLESSAGLVPDAPAENELAAKLAMVAKLIAVREQLGLRRQIFFVEMKGFDVHDHQNIELPVLFSQLSAALAYFQQTMQHLNQANNVTTFTTSDFGRNLSGNGDGTDHGWGNHLMVMGGDVRGAEIYGTLPSLDVDGPDSINHGRVLPTLAASQYASTLLKWTGLDDDQLYHVLPDLANFSNIDLGFLG